MKTEITYQTETIFRYEVTRPWTDPQGFTHEPHDLKRELVVGGIFHPERVPTKGKIQTRATRYAPSFTVPAELIKVTKITITTEIKTTTEEETTIEEAIATF